MNNTIGERLDDQWDFAWWTGRLVAAFTTLHAVSRAKLLDHLDDGPITMEEIAKRSGMDPDGVRRLFTYLASDGVFEISDGAVSHTPRSRILQQMASWVTWMGVSMDAGMEFDRAFREGTNGFKLRFGKEVFEYLGATPEVARVFADVMTSTTQYAEDFIFRAHDFRPFKLAVDVGGSHGSLLIRLLTANPSTRGILFDLPDTVAEARVPIEASGLVDRIDLVAGDFFKAVPQGADLYLLKYILHDWNDEECTMILKNVREAIAEEGRIAIFDFVLPETNVPHKGFFCDVLIMTMTPGRERRLSEFERLFEQSGFKLDRVTDNPDYLSVIEAVPV
jgi:hypothetical protein